MSTSARKERRFKQQWQAENDRVDDRAREIEAWRRGAARCPSTTSNPNTVSKRAVRCWLRNNALEYECATTLAEGAAAHFGENWLDSETHWIWDEAITAHEWANVEP